MLDVIAFCAFSFFISDKKVAKSTLPDQICVRNEGPFSQAPARKETKRKAEINSSEYHVKAKGTMRVSALCFGCSLSTECNDGRETIRIEAPLSTPDSIVSALNHWSFLSVSSFVDFFSFKTLPGLQIFHTNYIQDRQ